MDGESSCHCHTIFNHCQSDWHDWRLVSQKDDDEDDEGLLDELELEEEVMEDGEPTAGVVVDTDAATDESNNSLKQLRQRKDELTQKHLDQQRRKQQLRVRRHWLISFLALSRFNRFRFHSTRLDDLIYFHWID